MRKLIEIQAELKAPKNQRNNFGKYNYRSCEDILEAVKPLLLKHGCTLTITDKIREVGGLVFVEATAVLVDPEREDDIVMISAQAGIDANRKGMDIAQSFGSSSSYARKYALNGLFLIDDTKDADATNDHKEEVKTKPVFTKANFEKALVAKASIETIKKSYSITASLEKQYLEQLNK
jgi:hypothetical protein